jgi:cell division protein ZapA (FtsZ GTPase activity inhibitor)
MATPQEIIDGYLGADAYDEWQDLATRARTEVARYARLNSMPQFFQIANSVVADTTELESIAEDFEQGMNMILRGSKVDTDAVTNVAALYSTALDLVEFENDTAEAILMSGVAKAFVLVPFYLLAGQAFQMEEKLRSLEQALQTAKRMVREAKTQAVLDVLITLVTVVAPEVRVVAAGAKLLVDYEYGPKKPDASKYGKSAAVQVAQSVVKIKDAGETANAALKKVGKGGAAVALSVYSDWSEIAGANQDLDAIKATIRMVQARYRELMKRIDSSLPALTNFIIAYQRGQKVLDENWWKIVKQRSEFYDQARALNYTFSSAWVWKTAA